jgi:hypothetical protein
MARAPQGPRLPLLRPDHGVRDDAGLTILLSALRGLAGWMDTDGGPIPAVRSRGHAG